MPDTNRQIQEMLVDFADALRDGCIPAYLKSLTREESQRIASSDEFWNAAQVVRVINSVGFADKAVTPNLSLFLSRVDAKIASRLKKTKSLTKVKHSVHPPSCFRKKTGGPLTKTERNDKSV